MNNTSSPMKSPVMKQHDPDDDPFAALSAKMDANTLPLPTDFGSGAVDLTKSPPSSPKKPAEETSATPKDESDTNQEE
eukprot:CAMPEP_0117021366 /NCGR_PEP_ID=MMETSP0472-20121206/16121_1 /TAXON_ID=693140 ORGANISM="Tiarina fusus, Strain LIS" /NCGR_SAMPLE_ID=MMETSP0472 /ASSEMBLY_ACC=CAM_ASM_000603 /LENGTH=77 /DNA_ID=CAMNT_0004726813 /DNA_START=103 /DNA_END=336 /DNA_ORIENTATION=+